MSEAADALAFLAQSGFSVEEQISALPSVLSAAAAGQVELAQAADIVSNVMSAFNIEASETGAAVDVLVAASTSANVDLPMLAESMKMVGPVAAALNMPLEEVAAAIGILGNNGIQGSMAGSALRGTLLSLTNPTGQTATAMKELGIEINDTNGNMKPLPELVGHIADKLNGMTDSQKTATAAQLVGTESSAAFLSLLAEGETGLADYTAELGNSAGAAEEMARIQQDTVNGAFKEFQSSLEEVGIKIGDEFLPVFREIIEVGTDFVRWIGEFDGESVKLVLSFAGIATAIAGALTTLGKLSIALSTFAMTPVGAAVIGIALLGGVIGAAAIAQADATEINLEATQAKLDEADAMRVSIEQYDALKSRLKLSSDELERFVDINSLLAQTADPAIIAALKDEQDLLQQKSGLTNDEFAELLRLNDLLIESVPEASVKISEQGNVLLETTDAAKALNAEKYESVRLDLEADLAAAESKQAENIAEQTRLQQLLNDEKRKSDEVVTQITEKESELSALKAQYRKAEADGNTAMMTQIQNVIDSENINLQQLRDKNAQHKGNIVTHAEALREVEKEIGKLESVKQKMIDLELQQVGINAEKGKGVEAIDTTIRKLQGERAELERNTPAAAKTTAEYQEAIGHIDSQVRSLQTARERVVGITGAADAMNAALSKSIYKDVFVKTHGDGGGVTRGVYHTGGIVGKQPLNQLPKLHTGGSVAALADKLGGPMQHEMDVRLLRNEMVITESQQANLMRMIDAGHTKVAGGVDMTVTETLLRDISSGIRSGKNVKVTLSTDEVYEAVQDKMTQEHDFNNLFRGIHE